MMSEEQQEELIDINKVISNAYDQGWVDAQQALVSWVRDLGKYDEAHANFYNQFAGVIEKLQIVRQEDDSDTDLSEVPADDADTADES